MTTTNDELITLTPEQLEALRELGCEQAQGYHLGRPSSAAPF